jgi:release factor glutamine methyltransferase
LILSTRAPTLIPRPETAFITELLAQRIAISKATSPPDEILRIADVCTGSGCIALLLNHLIREKSGITGYDISVEAIQLARDNAAWLNAGRNVDFQLGDIWKDGMIKGKVDMVVSNPPYIPLSEYNELPPGVKEYEDPRALIGDPGDLPGATGTTGDGRGLAFYRRLAEMLPDVLEMEATVKQKGWTGLPRVAVEVGMGQARDVRRIFEGTKWEIIRRTEVWEDQYGVDRMVVGFGDDI